MDVGEVDAGPEDTVMRSEFDERVVAALDDLPDKFRAVVELVPGERRRVELRPE